MSDERTRTLGDDARDARIGRILDDFLTRRARGERVSEAELLAQHSDLGDDLREHLELLGELRPPADQIEVLITQGLLTRGADPRYPANLGTYRILGYIGRGGMGIVLEAHEESLDRTVALKILRPELAGDGVALERFVREAKAAAALRHPNIVTVHAVGEHHGVHFLAMEYIAGPSLAEAIRGSYQASAGGVSRQVATSAKIAKENRKSDQQSAVSNQLVAAGPRTGRVASGLRARRSSTDDSAIPDPQSSIRDPETIRHIFRQLLEALAAAHGAGLIHRDVKSSNILLDCGFRNAECGLRPPEGAPACAAESAIPNPQSAVPEPRTPNPEPCFSVKLADFGLARMITSQTRITLGDSILGTPEYMSPEQARGDESIDHRTDLYSAGVVLYEMLTGRTPFRADTPSAVIHQILNVDPPEPRTFNEDADPVLASLSLRLMAKEREERLGSASDVIKILDRNERVTVVSQRRRALKRVAVVGLLVLVVSALSYVVTRSQPVTAVSVDNDDPLSVLVRRGHDADWEELCRLPEQATCAFAELVDLDGASDQAIAVAAGWPLADGTCLRLLAPSGEEIKSWDLSSTTHWPDYESSRSFGFTLLVVDDIDDQPGDELIVIARDPDGYAARVSILDPRTLAVRSTFWHLGHVHDLAIVRRFFDSTRPALVVWGVNNQLNGFDTSEEGDEDARTAYEFVPVAFILDPEDMNGVSPPKCSRFEGLGEALPYAYAYLDAPEAPAAKYLKGDPPKYVLPEPWECLEICRVSEISTSSVTSGVTLRAEVARPPVDGEGGAWSGGAVYYLDARLDVQNLIVQTSELTWTDEDMWKERWHPIIQTGEYVDEAP